jgi:hypothetical protein
MKWLPALLVLCALPVQGEIATLDLGVEAQERTQWCWAAVSVMAINSFPEEGPFKHLTQLQVVARRRVGAVSLALAASPGIAPKIAPMEHKCTNRKKCNVGDQPLLFDIGNDFPDANTALSMQAFVTDIKLAQHPVIIRWFYAVDPNSTETDQLAGTHALLVTGYHTETDPAKAEVRVFDPLPTGSNDPAKHERWIPYSAYLQPQSEEGVAVMALHAADQYRMHRLGRDALPKGQYPLVRSPSVNVVGPAPGGFPAPQVLEAPINDYMQKQVFRDRYGVPRKGNLVAGRPVPIVAIRARDLFQAEAHPEVLLARRTGSYVVPVLLQNQVVDSFLVLSLQGQWRQGGYSSIQIANLLQKLGDQPGTPGDFYLVSIPELATFFAAHGFLADAMLKSLDDDAKGDYLPARAALTEVIAEARAAADEHGESLPPVRPSTH